MKSRNIISFCLCLASLVTFSGCSQEVKKENSESSSMSSVSDNNDMELVESHQFYQIYKNEFEFKYTVFDSQGEIALTDTTDRPLSISMLNDKTVDISISMGTGLIVHKYYDISQNVFSEDFSYVIASKDNLVAYIYVPEQGGFENRKLIVQNIFDKSVFLKDFVLDFSNIDIPVNEADFSEDLSILNVEYLSGEGKGPVSVDLNLE